MNTVVNNVIKLGGSVLTGKNGSLTFNEVNTLKIIAELLPYSANSLFVHGTGAYGKLPAIEYGYYKTGVLDKKEKQIAESIRQSLKELNQHVLRLFSQSSVSATSVDMNDIYNPQKRTFSKKKLLKIISTIHKDASLPVFHGDFLLTTEGYRVMSSDQITYLLAKYLQPHACIFLTDVDGVFVNTSTHKNESEISLAKELNQNNLHNMSRFVSDDTDVSGGMKQKAITALKVARHCKRCFVGNGYEPDILKGFLEGKKVKGTYVRNQEIRF